jgi:hypothetical protein
MNVYLAGGGSRPYVFMNLFLAGGISGNISKSWKELARQIIEQCESISQEKTERQESLETSWGGRLMNLYLAGEHPVKNGRIAAQRGGQYNILESFYYCKNNAFIPVLIPHLKSFLLDSGAFTFMQGKASVNWDAYTEEYAAFINKHDIKLFFELDIDPIVGLKEVERLRKKLEHLTGKKPIPVWHVSRGKEYFVEMCKEYPYVALGGIVTQEVPRAVYEKAFPWFIATAHKYGAKIHGLGYTSLEGLHKYHFDSVDSTAWLYGNRGGYLYKFNPRTGMMDKIDAPSGSRLKSTEAAMHNFLEWIKFQEYAEKHL